MTGNQANDKSIPKAGIGILNKLRINPSAIKAARIVIKLIERKIFKGRNGKKKSSAIFFASWDLTSLNLPIFLVFKQMNGRHLHFFYYSY